MNDDDRPGRDKRQRNSARVEILRRRQMSRDLNPRDLGRGDSGGSINVIAVTPGRPGRRRTVLLGSRSSGKYTVAFQIAKRIAAAIDPDHPSHHTPTVTSLAQMSPEKRAEMERLYGKGPTK